MSEENNIQNLEEKRRQKAKSFTLNIQDDIYDESAKTENNEPEKLNSYSGEDVKEQMAKNSKQALKKKKKIDKKLSKAKVEQTLPKKKKLKTEIGRASCRERV